MKNNRFLKKLFFLVVLIGISIPINRALATPLKIKLTLNERSGVNRLDEPVTSGVPLPVKTVFADKTTGQLPLELVDEQGKIVPAHFKVSAPWPDGSVRWVLIDFQASLSANNKKEYYLQQTDSPPPLPPSSLKVQEDAEEIMVDTGAINLTINKIKFNLFDRVLIKHANGDAKEIISPDHQQGIILLDENNRKYLSSLEPPKEIKIEESNPFRAIILIRGQYRADKGEIFHPEAANYTVRIYAYNNKDYVRVFFTLENNGRYGFQHEDNKSDSFLFNSLSLSLPIRLESSFNTSSQDYSESFTSKDNFFLFQRHALIDYYDESKNFQYFIKQNNQQVRSGKRTEGWINIEGKSTGCTAVIRHFWQNFPKAIELEKGKLSLHLWPQGEKWPPEAKKSYKMRGGTHKGYEILFRFYDPTSANKISSEDLLTGFNKPIFALSSPEWFAQTNALGWIAPAGLKSDNKLLNEALERYEKLQSCKVNKKDSELQHEEIPPSTVYTERELRGEGLDWYGWMDFGDLVWGGESGNGAYASGHYDWPYGMFLHFIRTGDYAFFDLGDEIVRHRMDVDQYHSKTGSPWLANFAWNEFGSHDRWEEPWEPNPSHTWVKGLILYHYLTGNPKAKEVALAVGKATKYYWTHDWGDSRPGSAELRIQGWSIENLIELYKLTGKKSYLDLATTVYRERTAPFITSEGYTGNPSEINIYQLVLVLEPLIELDLLIKDEMLKDDFLRILEFLMHRAYSGGKVQQLKKTTLYQQYYLPYYMNIHTGLKSGPSPGYNFMTPNALAYAYWITGRKEYRTLSQDIFKDAVLYWQEDTISFDINKRSPIAYAAAHFPGSRTKIHGWINRYPQIFLYLFNKTKQDTIAPAAIKDLEAIDHYGKVVLDWTAPGDDKTKGKAIRYQIKYSTRNIASEMDWLQAKNIEGEPVPGEYTSMQKFTISGLKPGKTYYFAIRSLDEASNISPISNIASIELK